MSVAINKPRPEIPDAMREALDHMVQKSWLHSYRVRSDGQIVPSFSAYGKKQFKRIAALRSDLDDRDMWTKVLAVASRIAP